MLLHFKPFLTPPQSCPKPASEVCPPEGEICVNGTLVGGISSQRGKVGSVGPEMKPTFGALRTGRAFHSSSWGCRPLDPTAEGCLSFHAQWPGSRSATRYYPSSRSDHPRPPRHRGHIWSQESFRFKREKKKSGHEMRFVSGDAKKRKLKTTCWR